MSVHVFRHTEYGTGAIGEMTYHLGILIQEVKTVLVCSYPRPATLVDKRTGNTIITDEVAIAESFAHISEWSLRLWLHEQSLLKEANPYIAVATFQDRAHLSLCQVDVSTIKRIIDEVVGLRLIFIYSLSVTSQHQMVVTVNAKSGDWKASGLGDKDKLVLVFIIPIDTHVTNSHIDVALSVLPNVTQRRAALFVGKERNAFLPLQEKESIVLRHHPEPSMTIL